MVNFNVIRFKFSRYNIKCLFKELTKKIIVNTACTAFEKALSLYRDSSDETLPEKNKTMAELRDKYRRNLWNRSMWKIWRISR